MSTLQTPVLLPVHALSLLTEQGRAHLARALARAAVLELEQVPRVVVRFLGLGRMVIRLYFQMIMLAVCRLLILGVLA